MGKGAMIRKRGAVPLKTNRKSGMKGIVFTRASGTSEQISERYTTACVVPLVDCVHAGKGLPPASNADGVKMKCNNEECPFATSPYIHAECFARLEYELTERMAKTGPGRNWCKRKCHANIWNHHGLPYLQKYIRCRCENGQMVLDRDAVEGSQESDDGEEEALAHKGNDIKADVPSKPEAMPRQYVEPKPQRPMSIKVIPGKYTQKELERQKEMRAWEKQKLFASQFTAPAAHAARAVSCVPFAARCWLTEEKVAPKDLMKDESDKYLTSLRQMRQMHISPKKRLYDTHFPAL